MTNRTSNQIVLPQYHFRPAAGWMGDINGPIYHNGFYHFFYQYKPPETENVHWGHARSKDLVHWEELPIALSPSTEAGENDCWSGSCMITENEDMPIIIYTSMPGFKQWAARGSLDLVKWTKYQGNPVLPAALHSDQVSITRWRDPFLFRHEDRTYLITGGSGGVSDQTPKGQRKGHVSLYVAQAESLTRWKYLGPLFIHPVSWDNACPNFFRLGDKWVLLMSRHDPHCMDYFVGTWNTGDYRFVPESAGTLGYTEAVYATHGLYDEKGRLIIWSTLHSWRSTGILDDWPGCLTLPRVVGLRPDGQLALQPLPELEALRKNRWQKSDIALDEASPVVADKQGTALEIRARFAPGTAQAFGLKVRRSADGARAVTIRYDGMLRIDGTAGEFNDNADDVRSPFRLLPDERRLDLRVFVDRTVIEVFANDRACLERTIHPKEMYANEMTMPGPTDDGVELFAEGGNATAELLEIWDMEEQKEHP